MVPDFDGVKYENDFFGVTSPRDNDLKLVVSRCVNTLNEVAPKNTTDYLSKVLGQVHASDYGRMDRNQLPFASSRSTAALTETLVGDLKDFLSHIKAHEAAAEFKNEWGMSANATSLIQRWSKINKVAPDSDSVYSFPKLHLVVDEMARAKDRAAKLYSHAKLLSSHDKGYLLMCLFIADLVGRRTVEGRMLENLFAANAVKNLFAANFRIIIGI